jgi:KaiC/GvpD/RAD55 family RecA-like ATPase
METDPDRPPLPAGAVGVGPWLETLLPNGLKPGDTVVAYGDTGVGATTLGLTVAAYAAGYGDVVWFSAHGCERRDDLLRHMRRLNAWHANQAIAEHASLEDILQELSSTKPSLAIVDRLQDLADWEKGGVESVYDSIVGAASESGSALWINSAIDERSTLDRPWGLTSPSSHAHWFKLTRLKPRRPDPNPLVVGDKGTGKRVVLELGENGLFPSGSQR